MCQMNTQTVNEMCWKNSRAFYKTKEIFLSFYDSVRQLMLV